jgi:5-(hydroxymethyl)furfural/furfural oxidase
MARRMLNFGLLLLRPRSRGRLSLEPGAAPVRRIEYNLLGDEDDRRRLANGCRRILDMLAAPEFTPLVRAPTLINRWDRVARINRRGPLNAALTEAAGALTGASPWFGDRFLNLIGDQPGPQDDIGPLLDQAVLPAGHHSGTCRMGPGSDPGAVVGADGRVHGFENLYVVDASVMPTVPRGNTNLPVLMIAEKLSDAVIQGL